MGNRDTKFHLPKTELYFYDENSDSSKPLADSDGMLPIQSIQKKWKDSFTQPTNNALNTDNWDIISRGANQTIAVVNGELQINSGMTAGEETILQTKEMFSDPFRAMFAFKMSQKIANTDLFLEAVSVDPKTGVADGLHAVSWRVSGSDSTTTTNAVYETQNGAMPRLASGVVGTVNAQTAYNILELELFADEVWYHARAMDSANGRNASWVRHQQIPDPNALFKVRIRVVNKGTAPASATTMSFQFVTVVDYAELTAEITAGRGNTASGQGIYATVGGTVSIGNTPVINSRPQNLIYSDTVTALTTNQLYPGTSRDLGNTSATADLYYGRARFTVSATAGNGHGHLYFQQSTDNTNWRETHRVPVPSDGQFRTFEFPVNMRYVRVMFQNGAVAQTAFFLSSAYIRTDGVFDMDKTISFVASTTSLASAGAFTGVTLNLGSNHSINAQRALVVASHDGTLFLEQSRDGTTWRTTAQQAVTANTVVKLEDTIIAQYARIRYLNGATAQTSFELLHSLVRN